MHVFCGMPGTFNEDGDVEIAQCHKCQGFRVQVIHKNVVKFDFLLSECRIGIRITKTAGESKAAAGHLESIQDSAAITVLTLKEGS